jgi:hypothetical protein
MGIIYRPYQRQIIVRSSFIIALPEYKQSATLEDLQKLAGNVEGEKAFTILHHDPPKEHFTDNPFLAKLYDVPNQSNAGGPDSGWGLDPGCLLVSEESENLTYTPPVGDYVQVADIGRVDWENAELLGTSGRCTYWIGAGGNANITEDICIQGWPYGPFETTGYWLDGVRYWYYMFYGSGPFDTWYSPAIRLSWYFFHAWEDEVLGDIVNKIALLAIVGLGLITANQDTVIAAAARKRLRR